MLARRVLNPALVSRAASTKTVTMIPGDGVGPDLMKAVKEVFTAAQVPVQFEEIVFSELQGDCSETKMQTVIESIQRNGVGIMGHIQAAEMGADSQSTGYKLRQNLNMYASVAHVKSLEGLQSKYANIDCVIIREQSEGEYKALEHSPVPGIVEALKITTRENTERIHKFAFDFALRNGRKKVTCVHKANIMKKGDGMFMRVFHEVAKQYPMIESQDMIVDNTCMQMVSNPHQFDVMVMPNLYGSIVDNLASGLVGGAGVVPAECYSSGQALFEPGARHSFSGGIGKNIANPTAMLLCSANMLEHMSLPLQSKRIKDAVKKTIKQGKVLTQDIRYLDMSQMKKVRTLDMGGFATTQQYTRAVISNL